MPLFFLITLYGRAQESDSIPIESSFHGTVLLGNKGFAPIPAFSFDRPLVMAFLRLGKGKLTYQPDISVGLNGQPWATGHWIRYQVIQNRRFRLRSGIAGGIFFLEDTNNAGDEILNALRSATLETYAEISVSDNWIVGLTHWYNRGFDKGTVNGNFLDLKVSKLNTALFSDFFININAEIFVFDFSRGFEGLYVSSNSLILKGKFPVGVHFQMAYPIATSFPAGGLNWNTGLLYVF